MQTPRYVITSFRSGMGNAHLIETKAGFVLVDTGSPGQALRIVRGDLSFQRKTLRLIYITHAHIDHYGSAAEIRRLTGAPVAIHTADAEDMAAGRTLIGLRRSWGRLVGLFLPLAERLLKPEPTPADILLHDGDSLENYGLNAIVVHSPGHTIGSSCLHLNDGTLFIGDLATSFGKPHAQRYFAQDWQALENSLIRVRELTWESAFTGHGIKPIKNKDFQALSFG